MRKRSIVLKPRKRRVKSEVEPKMERGGRSMNTRVIGPSELIGPPKKKKT